MFNEDASSPVATISVSFLSTNLILKVEVKKGGERNNEEP